MKENPEIGPGSGKALLEEINEWDLWPQTPSDNSPGIAECDFESLVEVANALWMSSPFRWQPTRDRFSFLASSSLSGAADPCFFPRCRLERVRSLSRFASLYANAVLIRDPFERVLHAEEDSKRLRFEFDITLRLLLELRAEIEAGIIAFAPVDFPLCPSGRDEFRRVEDSYRAKVFAARDLLLDGVCGRLDVRVRDKRRYSYLSIDGLDQFVPHDDIDLIPIGGRSKWRSGDVPSQQDIREAIQTYVMDPSLVDLQYRHVIGWLYDVRYLSDRPLDAELLAILDGTEGATTPRLGARVEHALPFIDGLTADTLLKLRHEEGEAFQVYRDRVRELVESTALTDREFDQAFRDLVEPELNQVDKAVASARKMVRGKLREQLVFGTGLVTIGLAAGSVTPTAGAIVSAFGGAKFGAELLSSLNALVTESPEARANDFYFLWKARRLADPH